MKRKELIDLATSLLLFFGFILFIHDFSYHMFYGGNDSVFKFHHGYLGLVLLLVALIIAIVEE